MDQLSNIHMLMAHNELSARNTGPSRGGMHLVSSGGNARPSALYIFISSVSQFYCSLMQIL